GNFNTGLKLAPGSYRLHADFPGFITQWNGNVFYQDQAPLLQVTSGQTTLVPTFLLPPGRTISGRITDSSNTNPSTNGVPNAVIEFDDFTTGRFVLNVTTGPDGSFNTGARVPDGTCLSGATTCYRLK